MDKKYCLFYFSALSCSLSLSCVRAQEKQPSSDVEKPNFVYILLDDMPYDMLPNNPRYSFLKTPNLERMIREGVIFNNYFCVISLSAPSRATNLTGMYPHLHGVTQNLNFLDPDWVKNKPYPAFLQNGGYQTAFIGKIHMSSDASHKGMNHIRPGFDYWVSFYGQGVYWNPLIVDNGVEVQKEGYMTDILTEYALDWIKYKRDKSKPFSLCLWHKALHEPFEPAARHVDIFSDVQVSKPAYDTHLDDLSDKPRWQRVKKIGSEENVPDAIEPKSWNPRRRGLIKQPETLTAVDESLGQIFELLEQEGILDNTVVIFSSDNGFFHGEHQFGDKRLAYENSIRIPLLIRYPKLIQPASQIDEMCLNIDIAPTIVDLAGLSIPDQFQGRSMKNLLAGAKEQDWRTSFLYEYYIDEGLKNLLAGPDMVAIRTEDFKYVDSFVEGDIDELYDLKNDPGEMNNLIDDPKYAQKLEELKKELETLKIEFRYNPDRMWRVNEIKNIP